MKRYACVLLSLLSFFSNFNLLKLSTVKAEESWSLFWSDEFDGENVNLEKWSFDNGNWMFDEKGNYITSGWGNSEKQFYRAENSSVKSGVLKIEARKENYSDPIQGDYEYTSSKLITKGKFSTCYGKIEVRAKVDAGASLWPAIWMLPEKNIYGDWASSGEIDMMEGYGSKPEQICGTIHYGGVWPNNTYSTEEYFFKDNKTISDWHIYAIEWTEKEIRWYVDGELYSVKNDWFSSGREFPAPFNQNFYIILNLAVGGHFDGVGDGTQANPTIFSTGPKAMEIDYVRVYKQNGVTTNPTQIKNMQLKPYIMENGSGTITCTDEKTEVNVINKGDKPYSILGTNELIKVEAGKKYFLDFTVNSTIPRDIEVTIEDQKYNRFFEKTIHIEPTSQNQKFEIFFENSGYVDLKFLMGNVNSQVTSMSHLITLNNLQFYEQQNVDIIYGDIDNNKNIDLSDLVYLSRYLIKEIEFNKDELIILDVTNDKIVDVGDLALMKQYLMGDKVVLGLK